MAGFRSPARSQRNLRGSTGYCSRIEGGRQRKKPRAPTAEEREQWRAQLLADEEAVAKDLPDICDGQMATGARIGEQLAIFWPSVDWAKNEIAINWTVIRVRGKGLRRKSTKSMYGDRRVKVPRWYMARLAVRYETTLDKDGPIYPNPSTGQGLRDPANTRRDLRKARGSKDFAWVTNHNFRKTAAKAMKDAGVPEGEIADQLGQGDIRVTRDHYLPRDLVTSPRAAEALEGLAPQKVAR